MNNTLQNNNSSDVVDQMEQFQLQDNLKRKGEMSEQPPSKKAKEDTSESNFFFKPIPTAASMGIDTPMDPDYRRLPKDFVLGDLAREKFAGIVMANLYDKYEIQIYCRLFEHFSYYPIYLFDQDLWVPAHDHAVQEVVRFRTPPSILMAQARRASN